MAALPKSTLKPLQRGQTRMQLLDGCLSYVASTTSHQPNIFIFIHHTAPLAASQLQSQVQTLLPNPRNQLCSVSAGRRTISQHRQIVLQASFIILHFTDGLLQLLTKFGERA